MELILLRFCKLRRTGPPSLSASDFVKTSPGQDAAVNQEVSQA